MSIGMQLSVICAEDAPKNTPADLQKGTESTLFGKYVMSIQQQACAFWPRGKVDESFYEPVTLGDPDAGAVGRSRSGHAADVGRTGRQDAVQLEAHHHPGHRPHRRRHRMRPTPHARVHRRRVAQPISTRRASTRSSGPPFFLSPAGPDPAVARASRREGSQVIRIENLHKRFGDVRAVDGVSFDAADGQVTALLGPNGAGKTTTLRMLYTLMLPDEGQILVDGIDAVADPQGARFALGVLPDQSGLYPRLTAREHIEYFGELQGVTGADLRSRTAHLLKMLDMNAIADRRVAGFSHGERTKTALARAIVHNPKNVLLDEPTNGLDVMSTRAVREIIRRLKEEGHTVLFSSHVMQEVSALCDTIVVIARGRIVGSGSPDDLRRADRTRESRGCVRGAQRPRGGPAAVAQARVHGTLMKADAAVPVDRRHSQGAERLVARSPIDIHRAGQLAAGARSDLLPVQQHGEPPAPGRRRHHPRRRRRQRAGVCRLAAAAGRRHGVGGPGRC